MVVGRGRRGVGARFNVLSDMITSLLLNFFFFFFFNREGGWGLVG